MKLKRIPYEIEAYKWEKRGDIPGDNGEEGNIVNRVNALLYPPEGICGTCGKVFREHGQIQEKYRTPNVGFIVCPGDYIIRDRNKDGGVTGTYYTLSQKYIKTQFEEIKDE